VNACSIERRKQDDGPVEPISKPIADLNRDTMIDVHPLGPGINLNRNKQSIIFTNL
jgi:hypothetical protein